MNGTGMAVRFVKTCVCCRIRFVFTVDSRGVTDEQLQKYFNLSPFECERDATVYTFIDAAIILKNLC